MHRTFRAFLGLLAAAAATPHLAADAYKVDRAHSDAGFRIRHFASKVPGRFNDFEGTIQGDPARPELSSVVFAIKAASIDTGNADRDKDLRSAEFFDVERCPDISFKSSKIARVAGDQYSVTGNLTMHCVSKEVTLPVTLLGITKDPRGNERASFEVVTKLNRKDFGMTWNKTLDAGGVMLSDEVEVTVELETVKKKPE